MATLSKLRNNASNTFLLPHPPDPTITAIQQAAILFNSPLLNRQEITPHLPEPNPPVTWPSALPPLAENLITESPTFTSPKRQSSVLRLTSARTAVETFS